MFRIVLKKNDEMLDDRYVCSIGPKQIKTCSVWESAIRPPYGPVKLFKTEFAARRALQPWTDSDGNPGENLKKIGITTIEIQSA